MPVLSVTTAPAFHSPSQELVWKPLPKLLKLLPTKQSGWQKKTTVFNRLHPPASGGKPALITKLSPECESPLTTCRRIATGSPVKRLPELDHGASSERYPAIRIMVPLFNRLRSEPECGMGNHRSQRAGDTLPMRQTSPAHPGCRARNGPPAYARQRARLRRPSG